MSKTDLKHEALAYHRLPKPGKLEVVSSKPCATQADLSLAYTPGVAQPVPSKLISLPCPHPEPGLAEDQFGLRRRDHRALEAPGLRQDG